VNAIRILVDADACPAKEEVDRITFRREVPVNPLAVVITGDILLADRCLKAGAAVIGHNGKPFTSASIPRWHTLFSAN